MGIKNNDYFTNRRNINTEPYRRKMKTWDVRSKAEEDTKGFQPKSAPDIVRLATMNLLAHSLGAINSGFASYFIDNKEVRELLVDLCGKGKPLADNEFAQMRYRDQHADFLFGESLIGKWGAARGEDACVQPHNKGPPPTIPFRHVLNLRNLLMRNPDVITLQEVDHYWDFFKPWLNKAGYECDFCPKDKSNCEGYLSGIRDGIAIAWKKAKFTQIGSTTKIRRKESGSGTIMYAKLIFKDSGRQFAVQTGHLKSGKESCDNCEFGELKADMEFPEGIRKKGSDCFVMKNGKKKGCAKTLKGKEKESNTYLDCIVKLEKEKFPVLAACDFNSDAGARVKTKTYTNFIENVKERLTNTYLEAYPMPPKIEKTDARFPYYKKALIEFSTGRKWRVAGAQSNKIEHQILKEMQDLISRTNKWQTVSVLKTFSNRHMGPKGLPDFRCASDHMEMLVEVRLRSRRPLRPQSGYAQSHRPTEPKSPRPKFSYTIAAEGQRVQLPNWGPGYRGTIVKIGERYDGKKIITVSYDSMFKCRNPTCTTPPREHFGKDRKCINAPSIEKLITKEVYPHRLEWAVEARRRLTEEDIPSQSYLHSAEEVIARRRLVDHARMEAQDADAMSPSELAMHRRRLAHGTRVSPVLAALMDEIEEAKHNHA